MEREEQGFEGLEVVTGIWKRRWRPALLCFVALFAAAFTVVWFLPNLYRSSATVLIERQQIPSDLVRSTVTSGLETRLQTISQEIFSRSRLESLIQRFGLYEEMRDEPVETVIGRMRRDIGLELKGGGRRGNTTTVAFTLSYKGAEPAKVAVVTNTLASFYIEENLKARSEQASETSEFLRLQLREAEEALKQIEQQVSVFKRDYAGQLPHQQQGNLGKLEQLTARLRLNSDKQMRVSERIKALEEQLAAATAPAGGPNETAARIAELRMQLRELRKRYSDKYPTVIRLKTEIAALVERLAEEREPGAGEARVLESPQVTAIRGELVEAETELKGLQLEAERIEGSMALYEQRIESAPLAEQEFQILMRDYETTTNLYRSLLMRQKEAELAESMEQRQKGERFRIIDPALPSQIPAAPNRPALWAIAALLSLGLAAGLAVGLEQIDSSFHTAEDVRTKASLPLLVSIPQIVTKRDRRRGRLRLVAATVSSVFGVALIVGASYWIALGNESLTGFLMR